MDIGKATPPWTLYVHIMWTDTSMANHLKGGGRDNFVLLQTVVCACMCSIG